MRWYVVSLTVALALITAAMGYAWRENRTRIADLEERVAVYVGDTKRLPTTATDVRTPLDRHTGDVSAETKQELAGLGGSNDEIRQQQVQVGLAGREEISVGPPHIAKMQQELAALRRSNDMIRQRLVQAGLIGAEKIQSQALQARLQAVKRDGLFPATVALEDVPLGEEHLLLALSVKVRKLGISDETASYQVLFRFAQLENASFGRLIACQYEGNLLYLLDTATLFDSGRVHRAKITHLSRENAEWWASRLKPVSVRTKDAERKVFKRIYLPAGGLDRICVLGSKDMVKSVQTQSGQLVIYGGGRPEQTDIAFISESGVPSLDSIGTPLTPVEKDFAN